MIPPLQERGFLASAQRRELAGGSTCVLSGSTTEGPVELPAIAQTDPRQAELAALLGRIRAHEQAEDAAYEETTLKSAVTDEQQLDPEYCANCLKPNQLVGRFAVQWCAECANDWSAQMALSHNANGLAPPV